MSGCVGSSQRVSSNPSRTTGPSPSAARSRASASSSSAERGRLDVAVRQRQPRPRQVDVGVDEPGHDRRAREVHHPVGVRRVPAPHALDVTVVDQDPLAGLRVRERVHAGGAVEGPHVARLSQRGASPGRRSTSFRATRPRPRIVQEDGLPLVHLQTELRPRRSEGVERRARARRSGAKIATSSTHRTKRAPVRGARHPRPPGRRWRAARTRPARRGAPRRRRPGTRAATTRSRRSVPAGRRAPQPLRDHARRRSMRSTRGRRSPRRNAHDSPDAGRHRRHRRRARLHGSRSGPRRGSQPTSRFACDSAAERALGSRREHRRRSARTPPRPRDRARPAVASRRSASGPPANRSAGAVRGPVDVLRRRIALLSFDPRRSIARRDATRPAAAAQSAVRRPVPRRATGRPGWWPAL